MMSFAAPEYLWGAALGALVVVGLHLLARRERRADVLPTARFVPERVATSVVRPDRLKDVAILSLRVLALALIGLAAARPAWDARSAGIARVIVLDRAAGEWRPAADVVRRLARDGTTSLVVVDSSARLAEPDQLAADPDTVGYPTAASLSAALVLAVRQANAFTARFARVELHVVSPLRLQEVDAATLPIRRLWADSITLHDVPVRDKIEPARGLETTLDDDDVVGAAVRLTVPVRTDGQATVRARRGTPTVEDLQWVGEAPRVLLAWPDTSIARQSQDSLDAVTSTLATVVGYFRRDTASLKGVPILWWRDGAVAATEARTGKGCVRSVGFVPGSRGDAAISIGVRRVVERLTGPCGAAQPGDPLPPPLRSALAAPASTRTGAGAASPQGSRLVPALLLLGALLALAAEQWMRRSNGDRGATE